MSRLGFKQALVILVALFWVDIAAAWNTLPPTGGFHPEYNATAICRFDTNNNYWGNTGHHWNGKFFGRDIWGRGSGGSNTGFNIGGSGIHVENGKSYYIGPRKATKLVEEMDGVSWTEYGHAICEIANASCSFNGQSVAHGASVTAYQTATVPFGNNCTSEARTCNNGTLSGSFTNGSCAAAPPANCTFNGSTVLHSSSVTAFLTKSVSYNATCGSQARSCYNGSLSGTYSNSSCSALTISNRTLSVNEDTSGSLTLSVATGGAGLTHFYAIVSGSPNGTESISGSTLTFTPYANWNGTTSLTYRATDANGSVSNTATITITVNAVNDAPVAQAKTLSTEEDIADTVTLSATDIDSPAPTTFQIVTPPNSTHGTASISGGTLTFTPAAHWNGVTSLTYRAQDSSLAWSAAVTVSITVTAVNDAPSVSDLSLTTNEDTAGTITLPVADVDLAREGDSHTWSIVTASNASHGSASIAGNKLTFQPSVNWNGTTSLTYRARDAGGLYSPAKTISITVNPINDKPGVQEKSASILEDTSISIPLTVADVDLGFEGDSHTYEIIGSLSPAEGSFSFDGKNVLVKPAKDWNGTLKLSYRAKDSHGVYSDAAAITVVVTYVNDTPAETGATIVTKEGMASDHSDPYVIDVDIIYGDTHTFSIVSQPSNGTAKVVHNRLEYTPDAQYFGLDSFTIRATDKAGAFVHGNVAVTVDKFNYAPTDILPGAITVYEGVGASAELTVVDPNTWGSHTLEVITQPEHGAVTINGKTLTFRTDGDADTRVKVRATDQGGLFFEKNIELKFVPAWTMFENREVKPSGAEVRIPAVPVQMSKRDGSFALQISDSTALAALGTDLVAVVTPSSPVGVSLEHRSLAPSKAMRLKPTKLTATYLEAKIGGIEAGVDGVATVYLSRSDMTGPVYSVPAHVWAPKGGLTADRWQIKQAIDRAKISFAGGADSVCSFSTSESIVKPKNALQEPTCLLEWDATPDEWRNTSNATVLQMEATARVVGEQPVRAKAYVFDQKGGKHLIGTFERPLSVLPVDGAASFALQPAPAEVYQKVQSLSMVLRQASGQSCDPTANESQAKTAALQWQARPVCFVRWTSLPEGMTPVSTWTAAQINGQINQTGEQTISWKVSTFTPSGEEIDVSSGSYTLMSIEPPPIEIVWPTMNQIGEKLYSVSQLGGYVGNASLYALPASVDLKIKRGFDDLESTTIPSYGRDQRISRYMEGVESPLWSLTPYTIEAKYSQLPEKVTTGEVQLLAVPHENIRPVVLNDERRVLDTESLTLDVQIADSRFPQDGYSLATMGDWDIRLLYTTTGSNYQPMTSWEPISEEGISSFEIDVAMLTNKTVRIMAEARVRSPVPEYESIRKSLYPVLMTVLNGDPLDGAIQSLRVIGKAPLRSTFYATTTDRYQASDLGDVRWELSTDGGATWETVVNPSHLPQRLTHVFPKGTYHLRAEMTNRHSGAKSMTATIEVIAYDVPAARLKGPANVFIGDSGKFELTDLEGAPLDTTGMVVEWSEDRGTTWTQTDGLYSVTRDAAERVYLMVRAKYADSPDDPRVYKNLRAGVAFRAIRPPRVQIIGPRRPEVGKEAVWTVNMMMPYPNMQMTMDGQFVMPDGQIVKSREVKYTPTMEDFTEEKTYIGFDAWINGYEDKGGRGLTQHRLIFWSYDWPEWSIQSKYSAMYAPADLNMTVRSLGLFREFEQLNMEWDIPPYPGLEVIKDTLDTGRSLRITEPGVYNFGVHVTDGRGNYGYAETELEFFEPIPYDVKLSWSGDNVQNRAPLGVLIRPTITGGHPKDRIETRQYTLNGEPLESSGDYGRATLDAGTHKARLDITSMMGHSASGEVTIAVELNKPPTCAVEVTQGRTSWLARSNCTDEDGRVVTFLWFVNGVQQAITSSSISVPMWRYPDGEPIITLVGVDDSGAESPPVANR